MEQIEEKPICIIEVNENLRRVELGIELTRPLRQLNKYCHFKEKYEEWCNNKYGLIEGGKLRKERLKAKNNIKKIC